MAALIAVLVSGSSWGQDSFPIARPEACVTDVALSENTSSEAAGAVKKSLVAGLRGRDWERVEGVLTAGFRARFPGAADGALVPDEALAIRRYEAQVGEPLDAAGFQNALRDHVRDWVRVERSSWKAFEFCLDAGGEWAFAAVHWDLGGPTSGGGRAYVESTLDVRFVLEEGAWFIDQLDWIGGSRVESVRPRFRDVTDAVGFHFNLSEANRALRQDLIDTRTSVTYGGLSALDWNRDGFWDLLATEALNQAVLFVNDGAGGFVRGDLPLREAASAPSQYLFVDLDNDGFEELVDNAVRRQRSGFASLGIHTFVDGEWKWLPDALEFENPGDRIHLDLQGITAADVDGNGYLDLFFSCYENDLSRSAAWNPVEAHDGDDNLLFLNHGELRFTEESDARGIRGTQYTFLGHFFDFDEDGDPDLYEGNDYGPSILWENDGRGRFRRLDHPLSANPNFTMGIAIADWENDGRWGVYLSNMYSHAGNRVVSLTRDLGERMQGVVRELASGNQLFVLDSTRRWSEQAVGLAVDRADWAWTCAFLDVDNDGDKELYVVNGNTSFHEPKAPDY